MNDQKVKAACEPAVYSTSNICLENGKANPKKVQSAGLRLCKNIFKYEKRDLRKKIPHCES